MIAYHINIRSTDQFKQDWVSENNRNWIKSCGEPSRLAMHLRDHLIITSGYPFWYCCTVDNFHERKVVMITHTNG